MVSNASGFCLRAIAVFAQFLTIPHNSAQFRTIPHYSAQYENSCEQFRTAARFSAQQISDWKSELDIFKLDKTIFRIDY